MTEGGGLAVPTAGPSTGPMIGPITGVTVFRDGARVVRTGSAVVRKGRWPLVVGQLPASADPASVRVAVRGTGLMLLEVEARKRFRADPMCAEEARLHTEVEEYRAALRKLEDEDAAEEAGLGFIGHLSEAAAAALARAVGAGRADYDELSRMAVHVTAGTAHSLGRRRDIAARTRVVRRELELAEQQLAAIGKGSEDGSDAYLEVCASIDADMDVTAEIDLAYHVPGAHWRPLYDLTVNDGRLTVSDLAEIIQRTGEDWPEADVVLSTARCGGHKELPGLRPWYIGRLGPDDEAEPQADAEADEEQGESGAATVYSVSRPLPVPADGAAHKTLISRFDAEAVLDYLTAPVLSPEAYLRATVTNGPLLLLPGRARIFHGSQFVGETCLGTVAAGEEFEVQLGVDDQIRVERKLSRRVTTKPTLGSSRTIDVAYEISLVNHRESCAKISLHDRVPVSREGDIRVRVREVSPAPAVHDDLGELTWNLTLAGGKTTTVRHRFTIDHPAAVSVTGL